jgi:PEGA domain
MTGAATVLLAALAAGAQAAPARAAEAIGVIIVAATEGDRALADNLTEVAMARIAETPGRTLVGTAELRRRLGAETGTDVTACLERQPCLGRVAASLGVNRLISGVVRAERTRFFLSLNLTDVTPGRERPPFFRQVDGSLADLIRAAQLGVDHLLDPRRAPGRLRVISLPEGARVTIEDRVLGTTPIVSGALAPGAYRVRVEADRRFPWRSVIELPPGGQIDLRLNERDLPPRRMWVPYVAYGSAGAAVLSVGTGAAFGILARMTPAGETREQAQMDFKRRTTYGHMATGLLVSGAVLGAVSAVVSWRYRQELATD